MLLMSCCHVVIQQKAWLILPVVICLSHWLSCSKKEFEVRFLPGPPNSPEPRRSNRQKNGPVKKRMASWARQRQQITEAADGGARARTGADGAVVLNLRRGPGAYALLSRADGQLTRAGQHYYSHLGLRPPSKDFDYNQPLIREGPNDYILLRNGRKKLARSLQGGEHRLTKLGKGFFRNKYSVSSESCRIGAAGSPSEASTCCLTRCATCSSGCLVMAPPSSFTGSQSLRL